MVGVSFLLTLGMLLAAGLVVIKLLKLGFPQLKEIIQKFLAKRKEHKVAFVDTKAVLGEALKEKIEQTPSMSWDDFEKICDEAPYVAVSYDEEKKELSDDMEAIKPEEVDDNIVSLLRNQSEPGLLLVGA